MLQDWNGGVIPFYTLPPSRGNEEFESAAVVSGWAAEFDADKVRAPSRKFRPLQGNGARISTSRLR